MSGPYRIDVVTIFPEYLAPLRQSLLGKAAERGLVSIGVHDLRQWTDDVVLFVHTGAEPPQLLGRHAIRNAVADRLGQPRLGLHVDILERAGKGKVPRLDL